MIAEIGHSKKNFYNYMKKKRKEITCIPEQMNYQNSKWTGDERFTAINQHFIGAYSIDDQPLPSTSAELKEEVTKLHMSEYIQDYYNLWENQDEEFSAQEIEDKIGKLKLNTDSGPMRIESEVLMKGSTKISESLSRIFNKLLQTGNFPTEWKSSYLIPIPKPGKAQEVTNYRGVCIQSTIPKIFDAMLTLKIQKIASSLIPSSQHGFTLKKGTTTNLLEMSHFVNENIIKKGQIDCIYLDLSKAFDKVNHKKLLRKLCKMSIPLNFLQCIAAFICNRKYFLKVDNRMTGLSHISTSAVPQGSHLGPLLYILFCADLPKCIENTDVKILSYADDTKIFRQIKCKEDAEELQKVMDRLMEWLERNELMLNSEKTYTMSFTRSNNRNYNATYFVKAHQIERKEEMRDLGVIFDSRLKFEAHINHVESKAKSMHGAAYRFSNEIHSQKIILPIIQTYITPVLEYCSIVWRRDILIQNHKLETSQRFGTRLFLNLPYSVRDPRYRMYQERLQTCKMISMNQRSKIAAIIFVCKCMQGLIVSKIAEIIIQRRIIRTNLRNPRLFDVDHLTIGGPIYRILSLANEFRGVFKIEEGIITTKTKLKAFFLSTPVA